MAKSIVVIGAGASGMAAAVTAASFGATVTLLEKKEQPGKKLQITGNGQGNYGNLYMAVKHYKGHNTTFLNDVLRREPIENTIDWFESAGMLSISKKSYLYPSTRSAITLVQTLKKRLSELSVPVVTNCTVESVKKPEKFEIQTNTGIYTADAVILAMGSPAGVKDEHPFNGYDILESFGHYVYPAIPALVPLHGNMGIEDQWDGVRIMGTVTFRDRTEEGEIQLTKSGISGIPVFQLSHEVGAETEKRPVFVTLDFLPNYDEESLCGFVAEVTESIRKEETGFDLLLGWLPKKLCMALAKSDNAFFRKALKDYTDSDIRSLVEKVKRFSYRVTGHGSFLEAQVANGGADTDEFKNTMESKLVPGLFVTGELLDIDGECGGYNLHFAFATGRIAGEEASK